MKKRFIFFTIILVSLLLILPNYSLTSCVTSNSSNGYALQGANELGSSCHGKGVIGSSNSVVSDIVNVLTLIAGIIAVLVIIYSGFKYITSGGDSNKITSAKNTLIGAIVSLIIIVLVRLIVDFVINSVK